MKKGTRVKLITDKGATYAETVVTDGRKPLTFPTCTEGAVTLTHALVSSVDGKTKRVELKPYLSVSSGVAPRLIFKGAPR